MVPPWASTIARAMLRPIPEPARVGDPRQVYLWKDVLELIVILEEPNLLRGWSTQLEIAGGDPILYIWAGQIAG